MSKDLNTVTLIGRLVKDPELRYTPSGMAVAKFSLAVGDRYKQNNEWKDYTNYFDITVFGNQAVNCEKYLKKGSQVSVKGSLKQQRWTDKTTNQNRSKIEVMAEEIQFLSTFSNTGNNNQTSGQQQAVKQKLANQEYDTVPDPWAVLNADETEPDMPDNIDHLSNDDDIPF